MEQVVSRLSLGLVQLGHRVSVQTLRTCSSPLKETCGGLSIRRAPALDLTRWLGFQQSLSFPLIIEMGKHIRSFKPDVIHAHNLFFRTTEIAALLRTVFPVPLVTTVHLGKVEGGAGVFKLLIRLYESTMGNFILHQSDRLIAVSRAVADHLRTMGNISKPVVVIPNGVDTSQFFPGTGNRNVPPTILFVGRLVPNKGPDVLLRAIPAVLAAHPHARFLFAGDGPMWSQLHKMASSMGIVDKIKFLGLCHDVPQLMREAAIFVRPSTLEGMPLTVLEAMASGLPVVATPAGGIPEILTNGVNGYLFPVGDSQALSKAIISLLDSPSLSEEMGSRGLQRAASSYGWESAVKQTERIYIEETGCR